MAASQAERVDAGNIGSHTCRRTDARGRTRTPTREDGAEIDPDRLVLAVVRHPFERSSHVGVATMVCEPGEEVEGRRVAPA